MWPILPHRRKPEQIPDEKTEYVKNPQSPSADVKTKTGGLFLFPAWLATQRKIVYNRESFRYMPEFNTSRQEVPSF